MVKLTLPDDSEARKEIPIMSGVMNYFPAALAEVAKISVLGNRKHNPDSKELHHARGKSMDHGDCIVRHTMDIEDLKANIKRGPMIVDADLKGKLIQEAAYRAWRSLAELQQLCEEHRYLPLAPAATLPEAQTLVAGVPVGLLRPAGVVNELLAGNSVKPYQFPELSGKGAPHMKKAAEAAGVEYKPGKSMQERVAETERAVMDTPLERGDAALDYALERG